jgi:hypothetical protein
MVCLIHQIGQKVKFLKGIFLFNSRTPKEELQIFVDFIIVKFFLITLSKVRLVEKADAIKVYDKEMVDLAFIGRIPI